METRLILKKVQEYRNIVRPELTGTGIPVGYTRFRNAIMSILGARKNMI